MNFGTLINGWVLAFLLALAILAWALREHFRYRAQFRIFEGHVRDGVGLLSSIRTPADFYQRIRTLSQTLEANPVLGKRWREYRATLLAARGDKPLRSPQPANEFFNDDLYRMGEINVRAYEALPNQFVGVGLCLTFFGLIFSLFIAQNVIAASADQANSELSKLLQAASFKFITSVVALVASVVFVFAKNQRLYKTEKEIAEFCEQLERLIPPVTPEELAEESNQELARQGEQLAAANSILATGIADALEEKLTSAMTVAMEPLVETVRTMTERLSDVNRSALEHMAARFSETLSGAAKEHADRMADMLRSSADAIGDAPENIRLASEAMQSELTLAAQAAAKNFEDQTSANAAALANGLRQESMAILEGISAVAENLMAAPGQINAAGEAFASAVDAASMAMGHQIQTAGIEIADGLDQAAEKIVASVAAIDTLVLRTDAVSERMEGISGNLGERLTELFRGAEEITSRLTALADNVSVAGEAAQSLSGIADSIEQLSADFGASVLNLEKVTQLNQTVTEDTRNLIIKLEERAAAMDRELASLDAALVSTFDKVGSGFEQLSSRTNRYMTEIDQSLAQAVGRLGNAIQEFDGSVTRLTHMNAGSPSAASITVQAAE